MKVASCELLTQKCDSANINDFDVTYLNKLNSTLNGNVGVVTTTSTTTSTKLPKRGSSNDDFKNADLPTNTYDNLNGVRDSVDHLKENDEVEVGVFNGKGDEEFAFTQPNSDSGLDSSAASWDKSVTEIKEHAYQKLEEELQRAREILKLRDEEVSRLRKMRQDGDNELLELTASLFEEAHNMVNDANVRRTAAEKSLKESLMKVEVLTAEVAALKTLVSTLTTNKLSFRHSQNQADLRTKEDASFVVSSYGTTFKKHHSSPSCFNLQNGYEKNHCKEDIDGPSTAEPELKYELDPNFHREFIKWKENPTLEKNNPFITRLYKEDIDHCLDFSNSVLVAEMKEAIDSENIFIEAVDKAKAVFPKKCALMEVPRLCHYRMKISDSDKWLYISQMCRNRIISVCNFLNYLRYIQRGLVKSSADDVFWEVVRLRKEMMLAKLGLPLALLIR